MLAAAALSESVDKVIIVERDVLPVTPDPRKGLPQARHSHLLWSGGARAIEDLLPGMEVAWLARGVRRVPLPTGLVNLTPLGWLRRFEEMQYVIVGSRDLLDVVVRERVLSTPGISVRSGTTPVRLEGTRARVTGVRVQAVSGGDEFVMSADLVVDASGRGSSAPHWLRQLGLGQVHEEQVESGVTYATRIFEAPAAARDFPLVNVQADARQSDPPPKGALMIPLEHGRWMVTLAGGRGAKLTGNEDDFVPFARGVRDPVVGDLIVGARPLTPVYTSRSTDNRRRFYERMIDFPDGFVVLGDAVGAYNPVYGHGMSVAALSAVELRNAVRVHGLYAKGLSRRVQRAVAQPVGLAWDLAAIRDARSGTKRTSLGFRLRNQFFDRFVETATARPPVARALLAMMTLSATPAQVLTPRVVAAVLRGPGKPPVQEPPLTPAEVASARPDTAVRADESGG
ncbi:NAD(P)/FAD-dependent oxidoreductase [Streptomyces sp. NPDC087659]|uniref:NAD(P)/FAD-dependent oxidoreductase n=1 Tax=Streptomyces sp. NPDC087659 TaxID=3365801 RepID=UPI00380B4098